MAGPKRLAGWETKGDYAITNGTYTIAKFYNGERWVYRVSLGREFIGGIHDSAKKALQSLAVGD